MRKKVISLVMLLSFSLSLNITSIHASSATVTETCTLPMNRHELIHTFPPCPQPGDSLRTDTCSVCGIATRTAGMETFHPEGAPSGQNAVHYVCRYNKREQGVASERCAISGCTGTGPHGICACGQIVSVGQSHQRTYDKIGIGFTRLTTSWRGTELDVHEGDIISVSASTNSSAVPVTMTLDGEVVVESDDYLGQHYTVEHDGHMVLEGGRNAQFYYLSPRDSNGIKYNLPLVYGGSQYYAYQLDPYVNYNDGIYMHGSDKLSRSFTRMHCRFMTHIPANTIVTMECNDGGRQDNTTARLCILDSAKKVVYSGSKRYAHAGTVIAVTVKEEGDYWVLPEYYWTYIDKEHNCSSTYPSGMVTVRFNGLVAPAQKDQTISPSLSSTSVGYGSTPPTLTVSGAQTSLSYVSSNTSVATIDSAGVISLKGLGSTTFTITAAETSDYKSAVETITLTVVKGNLTTKTNPSGSPINYGQALSASALSGGVAINGSGGNVGGTWSWKTPTAVPSVGTSRYIVTFVPTDKALYNY